uniref:Uncharacterized protein LOC111105916 isoform X2 n=1 Tax=Crassostrea virginica TaxID=6565 RepID=A0A8B8AY85_CRAVI|nr:uncharacterized protein LOC111105916 isoform X2 [Crassostrea virginica]
MPKSKFGIRGRHDERKRSESVSIRNTGSEKNYESGAYKIDPQRKVEQFFSMSTTSRQHHIRDVDLICLKNDQIRRSEERVREMPFSENEIGNRRRRISEREMFGTSRYREKMLRHRMRDGKETKKTWWSRTHGDEDGGQKRRKRLIERSNYPFYNGESDQRGSKERSAERKVQEQYMEKREKAWRRPLTVNDQRDAYEYNRNNYMRPEEGRFQIDKCGTGNKKQQMQNEDRWVIEPRKNSREENDDIASKNSSSEEQEEGEILDPIVNARSAIQICVKHASSTKSCAEHCNDLHVCKFHFISECSFENCKFGHDLDTEHNKKSLKFHHMQHLNYEQVKGLLTDLSHRSGVTIPSICSFYNYIQGCSKPKSECPHLHVCKFIAGNCAYYPKCKRSHQLDEEQPKQVLRKHGIEVTPENKDIVIDLLQRGLNSKSQGQGKGESKNDAVDSNDEEDKNKQADGSRVPAFQPQSELGKNRLRYWHAARLEIVKPTKNNA